MSPIRSLLPLIRGILLLGLTLSPSVFSASFTVSVHGKRAINCESPAEGEARADLFSSCAPGLRRGYLDEQALPRSGKKERWEGVVLREWIDQLLGNLPLVERAQVDLISLRNARGEERLLPRWVVTRYPVLLATRHEGKSTDPAVVLPWTSRPKLLEEELPLEALRMQGVREIDLLSWRERFGSALLERRTDPIALRGEKFYAKNCVGCHTAGVQVAAASHQLPLSGEQHQITAGSLKALRRYFEYWLQQSQTETSPKSLDAGVGEPPVRRSRRVRLFDAR